MSWHLESQKVELVGEGPGGQALWAARHRVLLRSLASEPTTGDSLLFLLTQVQF